MRSLWRRRAGLSNEAIGALLSCHNEQGEAMDLQQGIVLQLSPDTLRIYAQVCAGASAAVEALWCERLASGLHHRHVACNSVWDAFVSNDGHLTMRLKWPSLLTNGTLPYEGLHLPGVRVLSVSMGGCGVLPLPQFYCIVLTDAGVFSFGANDAGQLGHGDGLARDAPSKIEALSADRMSRHLPTMAGCATPRSAPRICQHWSGRAGSDPLPTLPRAHCRVVAIVAGTSHSLGLTDDGTVFSFGRGEYGKLGHGSDKDQPTPNKVTALSGKRVVAIAAGGDHSLVQTAGGAVFSFGLPNSGQLGHTDAKSDHLLNSHRAPRLRFFKVWRVMCKQPVMAVTAGALHSLVLTNAGEVFSFGAGYEGQLGHGVKTNEHLPKKIDALDDVRKIAAGGFHNLVLTENGNVYSFGSGRGGQLGYDQPHCQLTPREIEALRGKGVAELNAGGPNSIVLTAAGTVVSFGGGKPLRYVSTPSEGAA